MLAIPYMSEDVGGNPVRHCPIHFSLVLQQALFYDLFPFMGPLHDYR